MTLERFIETGSGRRSLRVEIEGCDIQFVSDPAMARAAWAGPFPGSLRCAYDQVGGYVVAFDSDIPFADGPSGQTARGARVFDGTDGVGSIDAGVGAQWAALKADCTLTCWAYIDEDSVSASRVFVAFYGGVGETEGTNVLGELGIDSSGNLRFSFEHDAGVNVNLTSTGTALSVRTWHRMDVVRDGATVRLYLDGELDDTFTSQQLATGGADGYNIAVAQNTTGGSQFTGQLFGLALRDVAKSTAEIAAEYADAPLTTADDDTVGLWMVGDNEVERVYCMRLFGDGAAPPVLQESVNIPEALLEGDGTTLTFFETKRQHISKAFNFRPSVTTWLASKVDKDDVTITTLAGAGWSAGDVAHIGTEAITVGVSVTGGFQLCGRAARGTIARDIWTKDDASGRTAYALVTNRPLRLRGRRVRFYLYGDNDDLQGDGGNGGEPVWRSFVTMEPRVSEGGLSWSVTTGPLSKMFDTKIGGELDVAARPRGIYYSWAAPLRIEVTEWTGGASNVTHEDLFTGFYETQTDFIDALNTWLATFVSDGGYSSGFDVEAFQTTGGWNLRITAGTSSTAISSVVWSHQDGQTEATSVYDDDGLRVETVSSGDVVYPTWMTVPSGGQQVPRGVYGVPDEPIRTGLGAGDFEPPQDPDVRDTYPHNRIYLDRAVQDDWTAIIAEWPDPGGTRSHNLPASGGLSTTDNWIEPLRPAGAFGPGDPWIYTLYTQSAVPQFKVTRSLGEDGTDLAGLRDALVENALEQATRGVAAFVTDEDLASWTTVVTAAARQVWQKRRYWVLAGEADLQDMLANEMRLIGVFPVTDSTGKIALQAIKVPNVSQTLGTVIDDEIMEAGRAQMARGNQTINRWQMKTGYNALEDEWEGITYDPVDTAAYQLDHQDRPLVVEPRGRGVYENLIREDQVAAAALPVLNLFGYPHDFVTVKVSWKLFNTLLGDVVSLSSKFLPSYLTGVRPLASVAGIVVGRSWDLGEVHGELRVLLSWANVAGYSPTARIDDQTNDSGNTWTLRLSNTHYVPPDTVITDWWEDGDLVRIVEYGSASPATVAGEVDSVAGLVEDGGSFYYELTVTLDATWTPSSTTWELMYADRLTSGLREEQELFCAIADDTGRIDGDNARTFAG